MSFLEHLFDSIEKVPRELDAFATAAGFLVVFAVAGVLPVSASFVAGLAVYDSYGFSAGALAFAALVYACLVLLISPLLGGPLSKRQTGHTRDERMASLAVAALVVFIVLVGYISVLGGPPGDYECDGEGGWETVSMGPDSIKDPDEVCSQRAETASPSVFDLRIHLEHQLGLVDHTEPARPSGVRWVDRGDFIKLEPDLSPNCAG